MADLNGNLIATIVLLGLCVLLLIGGTILQGLTGRNPNTINGGKKLKINKHKN
jgi:hypothetical protein